VNALVQIVGALLVLAAFTLAQARVLDSEARIYLVLNVVGAGVLAAEAYLTAQWGFLLLEGVWAIVAAWGLLRRLGATAPRSGCS
jgi:hypothetical protein